jgi:penicillin-insensitive murein endopeptidase
MRRPARRAFVAGLMLMSLGIFPADGAAADDALGECHLCPARQSLRLTLGAPPSVLSVRVGRTRVPPPPDPATLKRLIAESPEGLGSLSIGEPDNGALLGGQQLSSGRLWRVRNAREAWATSETLSYLTAAIEAVEAELPGSVPLLVGDLSRRGGGPLNRHRSHQSGRDVDLGWYLKGGEASRFRVASARNLDLPRCWALIRALVTLTDVEHIFMDAAIQRLIFRHALGRGEDREWLMRVFGSPGGRRGTIVQHEPRHRDHLHVRFRNPRAQAWGRAAYPLLVEAGLALPPSVIHRARPGDTLGALARRFGTTVSAIRRANGLHSSLIRAGHRYRIPTRFAGAR